MRFNAFALALLLSCTAPFTMAEGRNPEQLFDSYCFSCHGTGWDNAPVIGDAFAWEDRIGKGADVLLQNTINGFNTMPPKGNCFDCTDAELKALVEFLISQ